MSLQPLTIPFEQHLHDDFLRRVNKTNNTRAKDFIENNDVTINGIECKQCHVIKPLYCYGQNKGSKLGIYMSRCTNCHHQNKCPYAVMLSTMKSNSKKRGHPPPEHTVDILKEMFRQKNGKCSVKGEQMKEKQNDSDPFNMSPERLDNNKHYTLDNVILICQKYQIGQGYDFSIAEIRSWFEYDTNDGFVFDSSIFNKPLTTRRKYRRCIIDGDMKSCTVCNVMLPLSSFSGKLSYCKPCDNIRRKEFCNTPYGFMKKVVNHAKHSAKTRGGKRKRNDTSYECNEDLFKLFVEVITVQGGRCVITGIPMTYEQGHKFAASPDRIDNTKGYVKGNVRFIISPLNTQNNK